MKIATSENKHNFDYCQKMLREHDYICFLHCQFLEFPERYSVIAYYALEAELKHIHDHVSEEMLGHIRYAWWQEAIAELANGNARKHPVLLALQESGVENIFLEKLVSIYREAWPELPETRQEVSQEYISKNPRWQKAKRIINLHKLRHGERFTIWLIVKLLFV